MSVTILSVNLLEKIEAEDNVGLITMEEIYCEANLLGLESSEVIELLFTYLIEFRFTSEGF